MTNSLKATRLDFYTMKAQSKMWLVLVLISIYFAAIGSSLVTLCLTSSWFVALAASNLFVIQEKNNLGKLYSSLSLRSKDLVMGRYIFMFLCHFLSNVMVIVIYFVYTLLSDAVMKPQEVIVGLSLSLLAFSAIAGIQMPMYFRMGYAKAKIWAMIPFVAVMGLTVIPSFIPSISNAIAWIQTADWRILVAGSLLAGCTVLCVSYLLSVRSYSKQRQGC